MRKTKIVKYDSEVYLTQENMAHIKSKLEEAFPKNKIVMIPNTWSIEDDKPKRRIKPRIIRRSRRKWKLNVARPTWEGVEALRTYWMV